MICVPISLSSRGSMAFTLACVPTDMNTGVSTTPCAVVNFPRRAFVDGSVLSSSNIARRVNQNRPGEDKNLPVRQMEQVPRFQHQCPPPRQHHAAAQVK